MKVWYHIDKVHETLYEKISHIRMYGIIFIRENVSHAWMLEYINE